PHPSTPVPVVSVVTGEGLAELRRKLAEVAFGRLLALGDVEPVVTRARHREALERAVAEVEAFQTARQGGVDAAAAATHLRAAPGVSAMAESSAAPATGTGRHIVSSAGAVRVDFAARVHALGGTVLWVSPGSGLAVVNGLTGSTPATLASGRGIQSVDPDAVITLEVPHTALDAADAGGVASNADPTAARFFALQWNMRAVQADAAWAHGVLGSSDVSIFMLDSGIDYLHADLLGRVDLTRSI